MQEQEVFLFSMMALIHKDSQELKDPVKVFFVQNSNCLQFLAYVFQNIEHDLHTLMFVF